ncbi:MAG: leucine-rich repeat protein, partial [Clostridiales bacterium]|nr:leucine-rich repeat protein [Clostridiales bacterium]
MLRKSIFIVLLSLIIVPVLMLLMAPAALAAGSSTYDDGLVTWTYTVSDDGTTAAITAATLDSGITSVFTLAIPTYVPNTAGSSYAAVTSVGGFSGIGTAYVNTVHIPKYVTAIADEAFYGCAGIRRFVFDCDNLQTIGSYAFATADNDSVMSLNSIDIPETVTSIGSYAFYKDSHLVSVSLPDSLTDIPERCFLGCRELSSVNIPSGLKTIGANAFQVCTALKSIDLPDTVTSIGEWAFGSCALTEVTVPSGSLGSNAFNICWALQSVTLGDGVTSLGDSAFVNDKALQSLTIGAGLTSIGNNAFYKTPALTTITVSAENPNYCAVDNVLYTRDMKTLVVLPEGYDGSYTAPDTVTSVAAYATYHCPKLTSITLPLGLTNIGAYNLSECPLLQ